MTSLNVVGKNLLKACKIYLVDDTINTSSMNYELTGSWMHCDEPISIWNQKKLSICYIDKDAKNRKLGYITCYDRQGDFYCS